MKMIDTLRVRLLAVAFTLCAGSVQAMPYTSLSVFGDSISDTGNVLALTGNTFPTYTGGVGRFSNGPVWLDALAAGLGLPNGAVPANIYNGNPIGLQGGQNYAYGGARTGMNGSAAPLTGLLAQLNTWNGTAGLALLAPPTSLTRAADPNGLYVVFAGANDLRDIRSFNFGSTAADVLARAAAAAQIAKDVVNAVKLLADAGARHFLLSNLPDLGKTPEAGLLQLFGGPVNTPQPGLVAASTDTTLAFNSALAQAEIALDALYLTTYGIDLDLRQMDLYALTETIYNDAVNNAGAAFGITNVTSACIEPFAGNYFIPRATDSDSNCGVSAYSDPLHPSASAHALIGSLALRTAVPEPGSLLLVLSAVGALAVVRVRRNRIKPDATTA